MKKHTLLTLGLVLMLALYGCGGKKAAEEAAKAEAIAAEEAAKAEAEAEEAAKKAEEEAKKAAEEAKKAEEEAKAEEQRLSDEKLAEFLATDDVQSSLAKANEQLLDQGIQVEFDSMSGNIFVLRYTFTSFIDISGREDAIAQELDEQLVPGLQSIGESFVPAAEEYGATIDKIDLIICNGDGSTIYEKMF